MLDLNKNPVPSEIEQLPVTIEEQKIISLNKFLILSVLTMGLYQIWWIFKAWRFFMQKDQLNIMPVARAIFAIFFLYPLFKKIKDYAKLQNYSKDFSASLMFLGFLFFTLLSNLPDPFWLISLLNVVFIIPAFQALNFAKRTSNQYVVIEQERFNTAQIIVMIICSVFWIFMMFGLYLTLTGQLQ